MDRDGRCQSGSGRDIFLETLSLSYSIRLDHRRPNWVLRITPFLCYLPSPPFLSVYFDQYVGLSGVEEHHQDGQDSDGDNPNIITHGLVDLTTAPKALLCRLLLLLLLLFSSWDLRIPSRRVASLPMCSVLLSGVQEHNQDDGQDGDGDKPNISVVVPVRCINARSVRGFRKLLLSCDSMLDEPVFLQSTSKILLSSVKSDFC